jgi:hypothetical protein
MKKTVLLVFCSALCLAFSEISAQTPQAGTPGIATFDKLPADKQLFARDDNNEANVDFLGRVVIPGYAYLSVVQYRNKVKSGYQRANLKYEASAAPFNLTSKIKAELVEYAFEVYACKSGTDSTLIIRRDDVVAGDFFIIYGQSNAVAWEVDYKYRNEFARTYGSSGGSSASWGLANEVGQRVGIFGIEFQREIAEKYQIPTCIINGAAAGASLPDLSRKNEGNHGDPSSFYGALLNTAQQTGLLPSLKGIIFWQGETEASSTDPLTWGPRFDVLMKQLQEDYPMIEKMYVFQLPLFGGGAYDDRIGVLREQQRTLDRKYPIVQPFAALGAVGWNGFHYGLEGYLQLGRELADVAGYYHYGEKQKVTSPSLQKAYYSSPANDEVTMVFEDYQQMVYPKDTVAINIEGSLESTSTYSMKDFFYLNAQWQKVSSGRAEANKIIVKLKEAAGDTVIKYLPSKYHYSGLLNATWVYIGPFLKNTKGLRAFAFHHNKIFPYQDLGTITLASAEQDKQVVLTWNKLPNATGYMLERFEARDTLAAHEILHFPANQVEYADPSAKKGIAYIYRIRGYTDKSESKLASTTITKQGEDIDVILGNDPVHELSINVYPNPVTDLINIVSTRSAIRLVELFTINGKKVKDAGYENKDWATFNVNDLSSGPYVLRVHYGNKISTSKVVLVR